MVATFKRCLHLKSWVITRKHWWWYEEKLILSVKIQASVVSGHFLVPFFPLLSFISTLCAGASWEIKKSHSSESTGNLLRETFSHEMSRKSKMLCLNLNELIRLAEVLSHRFIPSCEMFLPTSTENMQLIAS